MLTKTKEDRAAAASGLTIERLLITPTVAQAFLDKNTKNRAVKTAIVAQYARDMRSGHWKMTGDMIRFNAKNQLIDGQHRLRACVAADVPFESYVMYGADPNIIEYIDIGKARSVRDVMAMRGVSNVFAMSAAALVLWRVNRRDETWRFRAAPHELMAIINANPMLARSVQVASKAKGAPKPMLAALHFIAAECLHKREKADAFVSVFVTGIPSREGCPAHRLRERLLRADSPFGGGGRQPRLWTALVHTWSLFLAEESISFFRMPNEATLEGFEPGMIKSKEMDEA